MVALQNAAFVRILRLVMSFSTRTLCRQRKNTFNFQVIKQILINSTAFLKNKYRNFKTGVGRGSGVQRSSCNPEVGFIQSPSLLMLAASIVNESCFK